MTDLQKGREIDLEKALVDPSAVFATPQDVVDEAALATPQKIEILRRWEYDAKEECVSVEEGMPEGRGAKLDQILTALDVLGAAPDSSHGPTKQQG